MRQAPNKAFLLELNTRLWLPAQPWAGDAPDLANVPDEQLDAWVGAGFDWIWFMGVWEPSPASRAICLRHEGLMGDFRRLLPDLTTSDVIGSPYAVHRYQLNPALGGPETLPRLRERMNRRGLRLMLDLVPNHTATDHPWTNEHPEYYISGNEDDLAKDPGAWFRAEGGAILAHGRDPYFAPWTDTAQINIASPVARVALAQHIERLAGWCDGLRCDMAMLLKASVFRQTWGSRPGYPDRDWDEFWTEAIALVHETHPDFVMAAEVYWGLEGELRAMGFDHTYDKGLLDAMRHGDHAQVRAALSAPSDIQAAQIRFVENHDEDRAAEAFGPRHRAAALITCAAVGLTLIHEGQTEGLHTRLPVQLGRRPEETPDLDLQEWYGRLLRELNRPLWRAGAVRQLEVKRAWHDNPTNDGIHALWADNGTERGLAVANLGKTQAQGLCAFPADSFSGEAIDFRDRLSPAQYLRPVADLAVRGLYLDLPPGGCHLFDLAQR